MKLSLLLLLALAEIYPSFGAFRSTPFGFDIESDLHDKLKKLNVDIDNIDFDRLPKPESLAYELLEDEFETYLDIWLSSLHAAEIPRLAVANKGLCSASIRSLPEPQPVYIVRDKLLSPTDTTGVVNMNRSQPVIAACPGQKNGLIYQSTNTNPSAADLVCERGTSFSSPQWLQDNVDFTEVKCRSHPTPVEIEGRACSSGNGLSVEVGYEVNNQNYKLFTSCYNKYNMTTMFSTYEQTPENGIPQSGVKRPTFRQGVWWDSQADNYVDSLYKSQKNAFTATVGSTQAEFYLKRSSLSRGHLAAKTDFILAAPQRATFTYVNVVPQWQAFNGGNWNALEQNLRAHIKKSGYRTKIYTGAWGILRLKDDSGEYKDMYLDPENKKIPVPLWMYKVVYDSTNNKATAFLGMNNIHIDLDEAKSMAFCTDRCLGNPDFSWLNWQQSNTEHGYSICCDVSEFQKTVNHLPPLRVSGLFT